MRSNTSTNPRKLPTQDRSKETVEAILQATALVLKREGYDRASTRRVAEVAGVSVGSLYQYFPNKESLVVALYNRHLHELISMFESRFEECVRAPLPEAIRGLGDVSSLPRRARGGDPSRKPRPCGVHGHRGGRSHNPRRSPRPPRVSRS